MTTAEIQDATPAVEAAHVGQRKCYGPEDTEKCGDDLLEKGGAGSISEQILDTRADVDLSMDGGPQLSRIRLKVKAVVPGMDEVKFRAVADDAKQNCPVSKALSAVPISLETEFAG